jgi:hypothetical protein
MDKFDRIFELHKILSHRRRPVPGEELQECLECSRATLGRVVQLMRDYLNMPIVYDRTRNGYYYDRSGDAPIELPGLWLNASELYALLIDLKAGELTHQYIGQIHPVRYYYAILLCLYFALIERWQLLCWLFQQFKKASWRIGYW